MVRTIDRALLFRAPQTDFVGVSVLCFVGLVYHGLVSAFFPVGRPFGTSRPNTVVIVYSIPRLFHPGDKINYPGVKISLE